MLLAKLFEKKDGKKALSFKILSDSQHQEHAKQSIVTRYTSATRVLVHFLSLGFRNAFFRSLPNDDGNVSADGTCGLWLGCGRVLALG